uniref:Uncharacterized protein n=1 Tax=Manihot esculenta TaxID=3983 RepID=A0A2C9W3B5_MANES
MKKCFDFSKRSDVIVVYGNGKNIQLDLYSPPALPVLQSETRIVKQFANCAWLWT